MSNRTANRNGAKERKVPGKAHRSHRPFIFGAKTTGREESPTKTAPRGRVTHGATLGKEGAQPVPGASPLIPAPAQVVDLAETVKSLTLLARDQGHLTYDDINDLLPEGVSSDDLDALYTRLQHVGVKITASPEVDRPRTEEVEVEETRQFNALDDPVQMYMNEVCRVPLLTREQEVDIFRRIEEAELDMKRLVYGLGFVAKEHCAIAGKLLADPPQERFDRIVVDSKVASREDHLDHLRGLVKKLDALDAEVDERFAEWRGTAAPLQREKLLAELQKLEKKLQTVFPQFFYKQKVLEDMVVIAGNTHRKFKAGSQRIRELEGQPRSNQQQTALREERDKLLALELFVRRAAGGVLRHVRPVAPRG